MATAQILASNESAPNKAVLGATVAMNFAAPLMMLKQKTAYEISACLVGSEMCIRDRTWAVAMPEMARPNLQSGEGIFDCYFFHG